MTSPVVIYVNGGAASPQSGPDGAGQSFGENSAEKPGARRCDPHRVYAEFPARWQAYIRGNFRNLSHVQKVFQVSEKTARNWWDGATGANGRHVAVAVVEHPVEAPQMLFAAE